MALEAAELVIGPAIAFGPAFALAAESRPGAVPEFEHLFVLGAGFVLGLLGLRTTVFEKVAASEGEMLTRLATAP